MNDNDFYPGDKNKEDKIVENKINDLLKKEEDLNLPGVYIGRDDHKSFTSSVSNVMDKYEYHQGDEDVDLNRYIGEEINLKTSSEKEEYHLNLINLKKDELINLESNNKEIEKKEKELTIFNSIKPLTPVEKLKRDSIITSLEILKKTKFKIEGIIEKCDREIKIIEKGNFKSRGQLDN